MASQLVSVGSIRKRRVLRFHGNRKFVSHAGYRVVRQRLNTTVLQDRATGRLKTVAKTERVFLGRVRRLR